MCKSSVAYFISATAAAAAARDATFVYHHLAGDPRARDTRGSYRSENVQLDSWLGIEKERERQEMRSPLLIACVNTIDMDIIVNIYIYLSMVNTYGTANRLGDVSRITINIMFQNVLRRHQAGRVWFMRVDSKTEVPPLPNFRRPHNHVHGLSSRPVIPIVAYAKNDSSFRRCWQQPSAVNGLPESNRSIEKIHAIGQRHDAVEKAVHDETRPIYCTIMTNTRHCSVSAQPTRNSLLLRKPWNELLLASVVCQFFLGLRLKLLAWLFPTSFRYEATPFASVSDAACRLLNSSSFYRHRRWCRGFQTVGPWDWDPPPPPTRLSAFYTADYHSLVTCPSL